MDDVTLNRAVSLAQAYVWDCGDTLQVAASKAAEVFDCDQSDILIAMDMGTFFSF